MQGIYPTEARDRAHTKTWWLESWYCELCHVTIRKQHKSVHLKSKGHTARAGAPYQMMASDYDFTVFLVSIDPLQFKGEEAEIYRRARAFFWGDKGAVHV